MPVNKLFDYPHNVFLMLRLEFEAFCEEDDLEAKIMRVIEMYVETERKRLFQHKVNGTKVSPDEEVQIPRDIWVPISYKLFREEMYDPSLSDNALRTAIKSLEEKKLIEKKYNPKKRYDAPEYRFQIHVIDRLNALLKVSGGRKLIPSKIKALKKLAPQFLDPSGVQFLDPSIEELSTEENLRGAETSPNYNKDTNNTTKKDTYDASASLPHIFSDDELLSLLRERGYSVTNQPELSTPDTANVEKLETEPLATSNPIATDTPQPTHNENGSQSELIERPEKPEMPPTSMKLSAEKIVQITEALIGKYYNAKQRPKQIIAAKKILAEGVTEEQYIAAYTDMRPWWNENQGVFHVVDLAAQTQRKQMRVLELIEKIETRGHLKLVKPAPQVDSSNEGHKTAQQLFEEKNRMLSERFMKKRTS